MWAGIQHSSQKNAPCSLSPLERGLQGDNDPVRNQGGAQSRPQAQEQHPPAFVVAQRLHRSIVDNTHGTVEGGGEVEANPARPEVPRRVIASY